MTRIIFSIALLFLVSTPLVAQGVSKIVVVDFERALAECAEGKKASASFNVKFEERKKDIEAREKGLTDAEATLRTQERSLSEAARAERVRDIERRRVELTRVNEDAQKELDALRQDLLRPIAERATKIMNAYVLEQGITMVIDVSAENNVVYRDPSVDITAELIKRLDAQAPKPEPMKP